MEKQLPLMTDSTCRDILQAVNDRNALLSVLAQGSLSTTAGNWAEVARLVRTGNARTLFGIGDWLEDTFTDTPISKSYSYPWRVNHFGTAELENGEKLPAMILQGHWATPYAVQFSHGRAFLACPDGLAAGTYYFTFDHTWATYIEKDLSVSFTLSQPVPEGGRVGISQFIAYDRPRADWKIYSYSADGKTILETVVPTFTATGLFLGEVHYNTRNGNLNSSQEMSYGWNRWKTSAARQYLNSDAGIGAWWQPQDGWDIAPEQLSQKPGFLTALPEELRAILKPVKVVTYANTVQDGGEIDVTYDKVYLPSTQEMHVKPYTAGMDEGEPHEYWKRVSASANPLPYGYTYPDYRHYGAENHAAAQYVRLRSAGRGNAYYAFYVSPSGYVGSGNAAAAYRFSPLVAIC